MAAEMTLRERIAQIQERIDSACRRAGRRADEVKLIAVSKTFTAERIREAYHAGLREFGENRVQEAAGKIPELSDLEITWHLIGHLQTNKTRQARELFQWIQSIDSIRLAEKLDSAPSARDEPLPVLVQVNLGHEETKSGLSEDELPGFLEQVGRLRTLEVRGLMLIPPYFEDPQSARPFFRRLRELGDQINARLLPGVSVRELSMGMSHDFELAIEEGATMIRVGTAIFGGR